MRLVILARKGISIVARMRWQKQTRYINNSLHLGRKYALVFVLDIICSSKLTVFLELRSRKTVHFSEQILSVDKYHSIFSHMLWYLSLDIIGSSKLTVFLELRSRKTVHFSEQIMSVDKYPSIFSHQMKTIVYISCLFLPAHSCYDRYSLLARITSRMCFITKHFWYFSTLKTRNIQVHNTPFKQELQIALDCTPQLFTVDLMRYTNCKSNNPLTHMASCG